MSFQSLGFLLTITPSLSNVVNVISATELTSSVCFQQVLLILSLILCLLFHFFSIHLEEAFLYLPGAAAGSGWSLGFCGLLATVNHPFSPNPGCAVVTEGAPVNTSNRKGGGRRHHMFHTSPSACLDFPESPFWLNILAYQRAAQAD